MSASQSDTNQNSISKPLFVGWVGLLVLAGLVLRLGWAEDMEFKADERYMANLVESVRLGAEWPKLGMPSGAGLRNPGMSVWVFLGGAAIFEVEDPIDLVRFVHWLNLLAFLFLLAFVFREVRDRQERSIWLWGALLAWVNPIVIMLHRKIWAQSVLAPFCMVVLWGYWKRDRVWGAAVWGAFGALIGQIHMSGFFLALALVLYSLFTESSRWRSQWKTRSLPWLAGSVVGTLPMWTWLQYLLNRPEESIKLFDWAPLLLKYYGFWLTDMIGVAAGYVLGIQYFYDYLQYPLIGGVPTYFMLLAHLGLIGLGGFVLLPSIKSFLTGEHLPKQTRGLFIANFWVYGLMMTMTLLANARHYLLVTFPLEFVTFAGLAHKRSKASTLLLSIAGLQVLVAAGYLYYVHVNGGAEHGHYGISYSKQFN